MNLDNNSVETCDKFEEKVQKKDCKMTNIQEQIARSRRN